jgi:6-pyruvoyltetrahydropterin/6-carboxytetrahydropterin synthase
MDFKFRSTKTYHQLFPVAYRQWRSDSHCNQVHGYALSVHLEFGTNELDARNWCVDFGSLKPLRHLLEDWFDHTLLVAQDDPHRELLLQLGTAKIAKITEVEKTGCEGLSDFIFDYINSIWLKDYGYYGRVICTCVEVRETESNMAMRCLTQEEYSSWVKQT